MATVHIAPSSMSPLQKPTGMSPNNQRASGSPESHAEQAQPIRAYAKLEFPGFSYYIQTLEVTIGRRPQQHTGSNGTWRSFSDIDIDLGPLKSISRLHARIYYTVQQCMSMQYSNMQQYMGGSLHQSPPPTSSGSSPPAEPSGRFVLQVLGRNGAFVDDVWVSMNGVVPLGRRTKIQIAERVFYFVLPPPTVGDDVSDSEVPEGDAGVAVTESESDEVLQKGKAKGKKRPAESEASDTKRLRSESDAHTSTTEPVEAPRKGKGKGKSTGAGPADAEHDMVQPKEENIDKPVPPSPRSAMPVAEKPNMSNHELVAHALSSEFSKAKGGKLTLQEVYEWLQITYPWFSQNGRRNGVDWQSAIRQTIGSSRDFIKIPRRPDEHGKGIFYALAPPRSSPAQEPMRPQPKASPSPLVNPTDDTPSRISPLPQETQKGLPRIPLIIGFSPNDTASESRPKGTPGSVESLLEKPPIAHYQGKLYLSPVVFGHLTTDQLRNIEGLGAQKALQVLQSYLVNHLKERMKRGIGGKAPAGSQGGKAPSTEGTVAGKAPAAPFSIASALSGKMPAGKAPAGKSPEPPHPPGPGQTQTLNPSLAAALAAAVKGNAQQLPANSSAVLAAALGAAGGQQTGGPTPAPGHVPEPTPALGPAHAPSPAPASLPASAPAPNPRPAPAFAPAVAPVPPRVSPAAPNTTSPLPSATPLASDQPLSQPAVPRIPVSRGETSDLSDTSGSSSKLPSIPPGPKPGPRQGGKPDAMGALSDLASHPEAAGLIALLKQQQQGGAQPGTVKLTPGQLELLQLANKLAAMQKKKAQQQPQSGKPRDDNAPPGPASS